MIPVVVSERALRDLDTIHEHYASQELRLADRILDDIYDAIHDLRLFPESGRPREESNLGLRSVGVHSYLVMYRITESGIVIVRVVHGARNLPRHI